MKEKQIIRLVSYFFIFCMGASLLIKPSLGLENENYLFFLTMVFYGLVTYILYMLTRKKDDYEYLFTSLASVLAGAAGVVFNNQNSALVLSLSLVGWISMVSVIKLIKIDYYHDRSNLLWVIRTIAFVLFLAIGVLTCINLYYNIEIQSLMLGFFFVSVAVLEAFDPIVDYLMFRRVKTMNEDFKPIIVKDHAVVAVEHEPKKEAEKKTEEVKKVVETKPTTKTSAKKATTKKVTTTKKVPTKKTTTSATKTTAKKTVKKTTTTKKPAATKSKSTKTTKK